MKKLIVWLVIALMTGVFVGVPSLIFIMIKESPPTSYSKREVLTKNVPPGGELKISISADINKRCDATVYRSIIDSSDVVHELKETPRSQETDYIVTVTVPLGASPGQAFYSARIEWQCNFMQKLFPQEVFQRNLPFNILPIEGQFTIPQQQGIYQAPVEESEVVINGRSIAE